MSQTYSYRDRPFTGYDCPHGIMPGEPGWVEARCLWRSQRHSRAGCFWTYEMVEELVARLREAQPDLKL